MIPLDGKNRLVCILILVFVLVKAGLVFQFHVPTWDEAVYVGMGKFVYSGGESGLWEGGRSVGISVLLGAAWKAGLPLVFFELLLLAFGAGVVFLAYLVSKDFFNDSVGLMAALLLVGTGSFFSQVSLFLPELPSVFFSLLAVYLLSRDKLVFGSVVAFVACAFDFSHFLLFVVFAGCVWMRKSLSASLSAGLRLGLPWVLIVFFLLSVSFFFFGFGVADLGFVFASLSVQGESSIGSAFFYLAGLLVQNPFYVFLPVGFLFLLKEVGKNSKAALLVGYLVAYLFYFVALAGSQERFVQLFLPVAAISSAYGFYRVLLFDKGSSLTGVVGTVLVFAMVVFAAFSSVSDVFGSVKERLDGVPFDYSGLGSGKVLSSRPFVAYYVDNKVVPYYFSTADGVAGMDGAFGRFERNKDESLIIFNEDDFECSTGDSYCRYLVRRIVLLQK